MPRLPPSPLIPPYARPGRQRRVGFNISPADLSPFRTFHPDSASLSKAVPLSSILVSHPPERSVDAKRAAQALDPGCSSGLRAAISLERVDRRQPFPYITPLNRGQTSWLLAERRLVNRGGGHHTLSMPHPVIIGDGVAI